MERNGGTGVHKTREPPARGDRSRSVDRIGPGGMGRDGQKARWGNRGTAGGGHRDTGRTASARAGCHLGHGLDAQTEVERG